MSTYRRPSPRSRHRAGDAGHFVRRRLASLLVVAGAVGGVVATVLLVGVAVSVEAAILVGAALFLLAVAFATMLPAGVSEASRDVTSESSAEP